MKNNQPGMTLIVKTITRLTVGLIFIYGVFIVTQSHNSPGSGFAGGVILALSFIHMMLAFGKDVAIKKINPLRGLILAGSGAAAFLLVTTMPKARLMPLAEFAVALISGAGLFAIFMALVLRVDARGEK